MVPKEEGYDRRTDTDHLLGKTDHESPGFGRGDFRLHESSRRCSKSGGNLHTLYKGTVIDKALNDSLGNSFGGEGLEYVPDSKPSDYSADE